MTYSVEYSEKAVSALKKEDLYTRKMLYAWIGKNLEGCADPRLSGRTLNPKRRGQWRYRIGDYRLICQIKENSVVILDVVSGCRGPEDL